MLVTRHSIHRSGRFRWQPMSSVRCRRHHASAGIPPPTTGSTRSRCSSRSCCTPLLVASTDLSHYFDAARAALLDRVVIDRVTRFDADGLLAEFERYPRHERGRYVACGGGAAVAVMKAASALGARDGLVLHHADSGDVSGDKTSVVGYLAAALGQLGSQP